MPETADITLNGDPFMLAPNGYERSAESPAPVKAGRLSLSTFRLGLGWVQDDQLPPGQGGGGWAGLAVHAAQGGSGLEPWPAVLAHADAALLDTPLTTVRIGGIGVGNNVYLHCGTRLYRTVATTTTTWGNLTALTAVAGPTYDLCYHRDDVLFSVGLVQDITRWAIAAGSASTWRATFKGVNMLGYNGQVLFSQLAAGFREFVFFALVGTDSVAALDSRILDSPVLRMGLFGGNAVVATATSLYLINGHATRVGGASCLWSGEPEPLFSHGYQDNTNVGDFSFLLSLYGRLYTWLNGGVMEFDPGSAGDDGWRRVGPAGRACFSACVAAGHLVVALETPGGVSEVWAYDGVGWWRLLSGAAPNFCWPVALNGAGGYDAMIFSNNSTTYRLLRLAKKSDALHSYNQSGSWTSPLLTAGSADTSKAWRQVAAYFSWPDDPGAGASADAVTITLEYSTDAGENWTTAATDSVSIGHLQQLVYEIPTPPVSRLLQLRVSWSSVSDWAPVLSRLVVDYVTLDTAPRRRQWKLKVSARDKQVRRDSGVLSATGRSQIDQLFEAWRDQTTVTFRDTDYDDDPIQYTVRVTDIKQEEPKSSDGGRWADGLVTLTLAEL